MKQIFLLVFLLPAFALAQKKQKAAAKTKVTVKPKTFAVTKATDEFIITGEIKGFADGTSVSLLNGQTGAPESETIISKEKFTLKGKATTPDFKILLFNKQQPYTTIFLDNSAVKVSGKKENLDKLTELLLLFYYTHQNISLLIVIIMVQCSPLVFSNINYLQYLEVVEF